MDTSRPGQMRKSEKLLIRLEESPASAFYRFIIGVCLIPGFAGLCGRHGSAWQFVLFAAGVLFMLRMVPAVLRHVIPFSPEVRAWWFQKRQLAKNYDSYQWGKVFWFGLGLVIYLGFSGNRQTAEIAVAMGFLIAGALGLVVWKRCGAARASKGAPRIN